MATPMPKSEKKATDGTRRAVVRIPLGMSYLLDLVSNYQVINKTKLYEEIWKAGLRAHLGLAEEECEDIQPVPLPRGTAAPKDIKKLVDALLG